MSDIQSWLRCVCFGNVCKVTQICSKRSTTLRRNRDRYLNMHENSEDLEFELGVGFTFINRWQQQVWGVQIKCSKVMCKKKQNQKKVPTKKNMYMMKKTSRWVASISASSEEDTWLRSVCTSYPLCARLWSRHHSACTPLHLEHQTSYHLLKMELMVSKKMRQTCLTCTRPAVCFGSCPPWSNNNLETLGDATLLSDLETLASPTLQTASLK